MSKNKLAIPRLMHFVAMMKENRFPNHPSLVREMQSLDIAGAYTITQKTLQRDVAFLRGDYGAPIEYDYQKRGYFLSDPTWTWDIPQLNDSSLDTALIAAHLAESIMPNPFGKQARKTVDALLSNSKLSNRNSNILLTLFACGAGIPIDPEIFVKVFQGWINRRVLEIKYTRAVDGGTSELKIEPHVLAFYEGCWYLRVKEKQASNPLFKEKGNVTLALHRIKNAVLTNDSFVNDESLLSAVSAGKIFDFPWIENIRLAVSGKGYRFAMERFNPVVVKQVSDDSAIIKIDKLEEYRIVNFVFSWPGEIRVIGPESLRRKIEQNAKTVLDLHKKSLPGSIS